MFGDGSDLGQRSLADGFQLFDFGNAFVVDEIVVLLGLGQRPQRLAYVSLVQRRVCRSLLRRLEQVDAVLHRYTPQKL